MPNTGKKGHRTTQEEAEDQNAGTIPGLGNSGMVVADDGTATFYTNQGRLIRNPQMYDRRKRTPIQREHDLADVAKLYLEGKSYKFIADEIAGQRDYTYTIHNLRHDIQLILKRWRDSYITDTNTAKSRELEHLNKLESEYWDAWERSKKEALYVENIKLVDSNPEAAGGVSKQRAAPKERTKTKVTKMQRDGEVDFLKGIERCIELRIRILGLDTPKTINVNWRKQAQDSGINPDEVVDGLVEQFLAAATLG